MTSIATRTRIAAVFLAIIVVIGVGRTTESFATRNQAQTMVKVFSQIKVGVTSEENARALLAPFARYGYTEKEKSGNSADLFTFGNGFLRIHHITEGTIVWASVGYKNGLVTEKSIQCAERPRISGSVSEGLRPTIHAPGKPFDGEPGRDIGIGGNIASGYFVIQVRDDNTVSAARRRLDWQIDLSCMTAFHGCNDPRKVLVGALQNLPTR